MNAAQVQSALGPPDRTETEMLYGVSCPVWAYGCQGEADLATLGRVSFFRGEAVWVYGGKKGVVPPPELPEEQLRSLLREIHAIPSGPADFVPGGHKWDPLPFIHLVNDLWALGRSTALAAIDEYGRINSAAGTPEEQFSPYWNESGRPWLCALAAVLFGPIPEKVLEDAAVGIGNFGVEVVDDIPVMLASGGGLGGYSGFGAYHVSMYAKHGTWRPAKLKPTDQPWAILEHLERTDEWKASGEERRSGMRYLVMNQVLRTLAEPYPTVPDAQGNRIPSGPDLEERWAATAAALRQLNLAWDAAKGRYVKR